MFDTHHIILHIGKLLSAVDIQATFLDFDLRNKLCHFHDNLDDVDGKLGHVHDPVTGCRRKSSCGVSSNKNVITGHVKRAILL